jgi:hypothetical protein
MTFQQIICTSFANRGDGIPNNIIDNATRTVTIQLEAKETVSCASRGRFRAVCSAPWPPPSYRS